MCTCGHERGEHSPLEGWCWVMGCPCGVFLSMWAGVEWA